MIKFGTNRNSVLVAGVPRRRGTPIHIERDDDTAFCEIQGDTVLAMHTPQEPFVRVHEFMHACHTDERHAMSGGVYTGMGNMVSQVVEDCRLHMTKWPWHPGYTPAIIAKSTTEFMAKEAKELKAALKKRPEGNGKWPDFATRLRTAAVLRGLTGESIRTAIVKAFGKRGDKDQIVLARSLLKWIEGGEERKAGQWLEKLFFPVTEVRGPAKTKGRSPDPEFADDVAVEQPQMSIIELEHSVRIPEARVGFRRTSMGPRLHRPSLRKVVLPQRLFVKRIRNKPAGTILIDASGSMGSFDVVKGWLTKQPFATVAYYAGNGSDGGQLFVYARNGKRAVYPAEPDGGDNTVDGPAMDWLLSQQGPRIMVTDRGFCGAEDSTFQVARLAVLERQGLIEVRDYRDKDEDDE